MSKYMFMSRYMVFLIVVMLGLIAYTGYSYATKPSNKIDPNSFKVGCVYGHVSILKSLGVTNLQIMQGSAGLNAYCSKVPDVFNDPQ